VITNLKTAFSGYKLGFMSGLLSSIMAHTFWMGMGWKDPPNVGGKDCSQKAQRNGQPSDAQSSLLCSFDLATP